MFVIRFYTSRRRFVGEYPAYPNQRVAELCLYRWGYDFSPGRGWAEPMSGFRAVVLVDLMKR